MIKKDYIRHYFEFKNIYIKLNNKIIINCKIKKNLILYKKIYEKILKNK